MLPRNYNKEMRVSDARNAHLELTAPPFVVNDEFGAILGVSSMDDAQKKLANIWLGNKGTRGEWHGKIEFSNIYDVYPLQKHLATYSVDAEIQSCVMIFGREQIEANDVNITMATLEEWMPKCLGLDVQKLRDYYTDHPKRSKLSATLQNNERYFLKLLYNYTKAGMPIPAAISVIKNQVSQH